MSDVKKFKCNMMKSDYVSVRADADAAEISIEVDGENSEVYLSPSDAESLAASLLEIASKCREEKKAKEDAKRQRMLSALSARITGCDGSYSHQKAVVSFRQTAYDHSNGVVMMKTFSNSTGEYSCIFLDESASLSLSNALDTMLVAGCFDKENK